MNNYYQWRTFQTHTLEWIDQEFEAFTPENIQNTLKQYKYLRTNLKYTNILDVYEQTKKLDIEELARMIWQGYIDDEGKSNEDSITKLKNKLKKV